MTFDTETNNWKKHADVDKFMLFYDGKYKNDVNESIRLIQTHNENPFSNKEDLFAFARDTSKHETARVLAYQAIGDHTYEANPETLKEIHHLTAEVLLEIEKYRKELKLHAVANIIGERSLEELQEESGLYYNRALISRDNLKEEYDGKPFIYNENQLQAIAELTKNKWQGLREIALNLLRDSDNLEYIDALITYIEENPKSVTVSNQSISDFQHNLYPKGEAEDLRRKLNHPENSAKREEYITLLTQYRDRTDHRFSEIAKATLALLAT